MQNKYWWVYGFLLCWLLLLTGCGAFQAMGNAVVWVFDQAFGSPIPPGGVDANDGAVDLLKVFGLGGWAASAIGNVWQHLRGSNWKGAAVSTSAGIEHWLQEHPEHKAGITKVLERYQKKMLKVTKNGDGFDAIKFIEKVALPKAKLLFAETSKS